MKSIFRIIFVLLCFCLSGVVNAAEVTKESIDEHAKIIDTTVSLNEVNKELEKNIWITRYNNYLTYRKLKKELVQIRKDAKKYGNWKGEKYKELSYQLNNKIRIKENKGIHDGVFNW